MNEGARHKVILLGALKPFQLGREFNRSELVRTKFATTLAEYLGLGN